MNKLKDSYIHFWKSKICDDSKNQPNGNNLKTYTTFKICYEKETYLFVNELLRNEVSTFAKLRISSRDLHIERGRHRKIILSERKCFLCNNSVEDEKHFVMECFSLSAHRNNFLMN